MWPNLDPRTPYLSQKYSNTYRNMERPWKSYFSFFFLYFFFVVRNPKHATGTREAWKWIFERYRRIHVGARWRSRGKREPSSRQLIFLEDPRINMHWCDQLNHRNKHRKWAKTKENKETIQVNTAWLLRTAALYKWMPGRIYTAVPKAPGKRRSLPSGGEWGHPTARKTKKIRVVILVAATCQCTPTKWANNKNIN